MKNLLEALKAKSDEPQERDYVTAPQQPEDIDWNTIEGFEGGRQQQGYVPESGRSGVTVSSGFDVGQREHLQGLPEDIQAKLQPFVGKRREEAQRALASAGGVQLSPEEADKVAEFAKNETQQKLMADWSKVSDVPFESLSPAQKTVLASVAHQYGGLTRTPRFAQFAGKGQWEKVVKELQNFKDQYKTRRNKEARYLAQSLDKKK
jgi:hypothetical protein